MTRISDTTLPATFVDGEVLRGWQVNKIITVLKTGVNVNKNDIDKILMGEASDFVFANKTLADEYLADNLSAEPAYPTTDQYAIVMSGEADSDVIEIYKFNNDYTTVGAAWVLQSGEAFSIFEAYRIAKDYDDRMTNAEAELISIETDIANGVYSHKKLKYDTASPSSTLNVGETRWNATEKTLETRLTANVIARHNRDLFVYCKNTELVTLNPGTPVYISGSSGSDNLFYIKKANNNDYLKTSRCFGITGELITTNNYGFVCIKGIVGYLNTNAFTVGDVVYLGSTGTLTNVRPTKNILALGVVLQKSLSSGSIAVNSVFFPRPEDLSTVNFIGLAEGDAIIRTASGWENQPVYTKSEADSKFVDVLGDTMSGALAMGTNKITDLGDGSSDQDAATIKNLSNHNISETAHTYIRTLIEALEHEIERLDGRGSSYGEIAYTTATLLALDVATRDTTITNAIIAGFGGAAYVPLSGHIVYDTGVGNGVGYHEWEYNGTNWVDNGMLGSGKASNDLFGFIKGDGTYLSVVAGIVQVLLSDYAAKLGTSVANYTYTDIYNALANRYTKNETDALLDALKTAFGWEESELHSRTYTSADTFPYGTNAEIMDYSELSLYDYALITYVLDGEHKTQLVRIDANILADGILFKYENDGASNFIQLYMDASKDYLLFDTNYNLTPSGSHTLKLQIDGIKIKTFDASLVAFDGTGTNYVSAETDVESAIVVLDDELHDAWTEIGAIEEGSVAVGVAGKATYDANDDQIDTTYEKVANKVTEWSETPDDTHYPSEKLVDDRITPIEANVEVLQLDNATKSKQILDIEENLRKTMANEVTGTASGTDIISLGKDVANAPLKVEIDGGLLYAPQLVTNGDFSDGTTGWVAQPNISGFAVNSGIMQFERTGVDSYIYKLKTISISKYYMIYRAKSPSNTFNMNLSGSYALNHSGSDIFEIISQVVDVTSNLTNVRLQTGAVGVNYVDYAYLFNISPLIANKQYSPLYDTTFDLMTDANIKTQMDLWINNGTLPNANLLATSFDKRIRSVGKNLFDNSNIIDGSHYGADGSITVGVGSQRQSLYTRVKPSTQYAVSSTSLLISQYDINYTHIQRINGVSQFTTPANCHYVRLSVAYSNTILPTTQLELGSTATTYEPYVNTDMYLQANANGYRLPNLTKCTEEIRNGKAYYVQRIRKLILDGSLSWVFNNDFVGYKRISLNISDITASVDGGNMIIKTNIDTSITILRYGIDGFTAGEQANSNVGQLLITISDTVSGWGESETVTTAMIKTYFTNNPYTIYYQLVTPITTEILALGNLTGYANGTVYIDDIMQDADIYGTNATVSNSDYPILALDKIVKINSDGSQTALAVSGATVASGGLSFTHALLTSGDKVWFSYYYDVDDLMKSTTTITYYDNKNVVSGSGTTAGKIYKLVPTIVDENIVWTKVEV